MKVLEDVTVDNKRVLVRIDVNVPLDGEGRITDDTRIRAVLPTITYLTDRNARVLLASHLGRPKGKVVPAMSLAPVARRLSDLLDRPVKMAPDCVGQEVEAMAEDMAPGEVVLLENLRFHPEEGDNDDAFGRSLAALCDVYVNDAFAVSHRKNASVAAAAGHAPVAAAGFLLKREMDYFHKAMRDPHRPLVAVIGGAKVSSKLTALEHMLEKVDKLIIGGAMANTFLMCQGWSMGRSLVEPDLVDTAAAILSGAKKRGVRVYLPVDFVAAPSMEAESAVRLVPAQEIPDDWMALDIGPATARLFAEALYDAKTVVWNGPMGVFETDAFSRGTMAVARHIAESHALTIVGGGDTNAAVEMAGETANMGYISTGGGAFLALLEGKRLPGVAALEQA